MEGSVDETAKAVSNLAVDSSSSDPAAGEETISKKARKKELKMKQKEEERRRKEEEKRQKEAERVLGHSILALILWNRAKSVDIGSKTAITSCYMFIWKLFYAEYLLIPFVR